MLDALLSQASAVVAAWVVAIAAVAAAVIYWLTFKSVNEQTKISREQLEASRAQLQASRAQFEERYEPRLKVEVVAYIPAEAAMKDTGRETEDFTDQPWGRDSARIESDRHVSRQRVLTVANGKQSICFSGLSA